MPLALIGALLISGPVAFAATVGPTDAASAHTGTVKVTADCLPDGTRKVTYTGATSSVPTSGSGHTAQLTVGEILPVNTVVTPAVQTVVGNTSYTWTQIVPGTAKSAQSTAFLVWGDGHKEDPIGQISFPTDCKPVVAPPTQTVNCDVITGNYNRPLTNGDHINATITPPGSQVNMYVDQNVAGGASYNGQNNLGLRWKILGVEQTPIPLTLDQIKAGIISLPYGAELKKTQAVWTVSFIQTNETDTWPNFNCNTTVTIPTPAAVTASDVCGVDNDALNVPKDTDKVAYTVNDSRVKGVGSVTVKATAKAGFEFDKNAVTSWTFQFTNVPCPIVITTFAAATAVDKCDIKNDTLTVPKDTEQVAYTVTDTRVAGVGSVTVKATAKTGYEFGKDAVTSWTFPFTNEACPLVVTTPASVTAEDTCGTTNDKLNVPKDTNEVAYTVNDSRVKGVGSVTVTAAAKEGYVLKEGSTKSWTFEFIDEPCVTVITTFTAASAVDKCGVSNDELNIPKDTAEVAYTVTDSRVDGAGSVVVKATAKTGFEFDKNAVTSWTFEFSSEQCVVTITTFAAASATDTCGVDNDTLTVPKDTNEVAYTVTDSRVDGVGSVTVTANAKTGYEFKKDAVTSWTFKFTNEACIVIVTKLAAVTATDVCGIDKDTLTVPKDTDQVAYTVTDSRIKGVGSVTVNATAKAGYELDKSVVSSWTFKFTNEACPVTTTPKPVTPSGGIDTGLFGSDPSADAGGLNPIGISVLALMALLATAAVATIARKRRQTASNTAGE